MPNKQLRDLLKEYTLKFDAHAMRNMMTLLEQHTPVLARFISWCDETYDSWHCLPKAIRAFVQCFSRTSPVCSYFPPVDDFFVHVRSLSHVATTIGDQSEAMMCIQAVSPIIFEALTTIKDSKLPAAWSDLFGLLEDITTKTFRRQPHQLSPPTHSQCQSSFAYFPNWPAKCARGIYKLDNVKCTSEQCKKEKPGKHSLLPGIFTVYCEHGKNNN